VCYVLVQVAGLHVDSSAIHWLCDRSTVATNRNACAATEKEAFKATQTGTRTDVETKRTSSPVSTDDAMLTGSHVSSGSDGAQRIVAPLSSAGPVSIPQVLVRWNQA